MLAIITNRQSLLFTNISSYTVFIYLTVFLGFKEERNTSQTMKCIHVDGYQDNEVM